MNLWKRFLPGLQTLSEYQAAWFPRDLMAGLVLTAMLVLKRFDLFERFGGAANFYPTIGSAVDAYLEEHAVDWKP